MVETATYPLMDDDDVVCIECDRLIPRGAPYGEALTGMSGDTPVVELCCVYCAMVAS